eukprot:362622-Chlamydomonas_euryale.AAC.3
MRLCCTPLYYRQSYYARPSCRTLTGVGASALTVWAPVPLKPMVLSKCVRTCRRHRIAYRGAAASPRLHTHWDPRPGSTHWDPHFQVHPPRRTSWGQTRWVDTLSSTHCRGCGQNGCTASKPGPCVSGPHSAAPLMQLCLRYSCASRAAAPPMQLRLACSCASGAAAPRVQLRLWCSCASRAAAPPMQLRLRCSCASDAGPCSGSCRSYKLQPSPIV